MASSSFSDDVRNVLMDTMNLPQEFLNYMIQNQALNPVPTVKTSIYVALATNTSSVSTAGTTFGTGSDLLATDISFGANGISSYNIKVTAASWQNTVSGGANFLYLKYDGAQAGEMAVINCPGVSYNVPCSGFLHLDKPSAGTHTVNVRLVVNSGTGTVVAGAGGAANAVPITVTIEIA